MKTNIDATHGTLLEKKRKENDYTCVNMLNNFT